MPPTEILQSIPAVALFVERAQAVKPDFALTGQNAQSVAVICAQLDGLPLAIELAAARVRLFSPQEMQARLQAPETASQGRENRLPLLTGGPRNLPARQRTLRAAVDWSYNLLSEGEQALLARLGVFVGGCTISSATAVCNGERELITSTTQALPFDIQEGMQSLVDKNMLSRREGVDGESRFGM
jgi:predicted ATPase